MITSGLVSFEDGKKAAEDYAPARKVRVDLHFTVEPTEDAIAVLQAAGAQARRSVYSLLSPHSTPITAVPEVPPEVVVEPVKEAKAARTRAKKEPLPPVESFLGAPEGAAAVGGSKDELPGETKVQEDVSDAAIRQAVLSRNAQIKNPKGISELCAQFCPQDGVPPSLRRIPEDKRSAFLVALQAMK